MARRRERLIDYWDPLQGEHYTRRPLTTVRDLGLTIVDTERLTHGAIERVHARKPSVP